MSVCVSSPGEAGSLDVLVRQRKWEHRLVAHELEGISGPSGSSSAASVRPLIPEWWLCCPSMSPRPVTGERCHVKITLPLTEVHWFVLSPLSLCKVDTPPFASNQREKHKASPLFHSLVSSLYLSSLTFWSLARVLHVLCFPSWQTLVLNLTLSSLSL